jgi:hypothetical protein
MTVVAGFGDVFVRTADAARSMVDRDHRWPTISVLFAALATYRLRVWFTDWLQPEHSDQISHVSARADWQPLRVATV